MFINFTEDAAKEDDRETDSLIKSGFAKIEEILLSKKRESKSLSGIGMSDWRKIANALKLKEVTLVASQEPGKDSIPGYQWTDLAEDHRDQVKNYMSYIEKYWMPLLPNDIQVLDISQKKQLLTLKDDPRLPFDIKGGADLAIVHNSYVNFRSIFAGIHFIVELKKKIEENHINQIKAELIAADTVTTNIARSVVGLLTDLNNDWNFFWIGEDGVVCHIFFNSINNAMNFIREIIDGDWKEGFQSSFIPSQKFKRIKINDHMPIYFDTEEIERYELMADTLDPDFLHQKRMEFAQKIVEHTSTYQSMMYA